MIIAARIHPNAKKSEVIRDESGQLDVYVVEPAIDNKANVACIKVLAKFLKIKKSQLILIKGEKSKEKVFSTL